MLGKLRTVYTAIEAANELEKENISCEVIDPRTLVPLDINLITKSVKKTGRLVIVDECTKTGGWAGEVAASVQEKIFPFLKKPIIRVTAPDSPVPFAPNLEKYYIPNKKDIKKAVKNLL